MGPLLAVRALLQGLGSLQRSHRQSVLDTKNLEARSDPHGTSLPASALFDSRP